MQHKNVSRGDKVVLVTSTGERLTRIVWDAKEKFVLLCSERQFNWLLAGDQRAAPIGYRWREIQDA